MSFLIVGLAAFLASLLTLFSGFGLGTLLLPVMGLFFPLHLAVAVTGVVHLLNNLFKAALLGRQADWGLVFRFGIPSVLGGFVGAWLLSSLLDIPVWFTWSIGEQVFEVTAIKSIIGALMLLFALQELTPFGQRMQFSPRFLTIGGLISGFFGGLSGHQGALRSAFLINTGLDKTAFVATGVLIAIMVDLTRVPVYASAFSTTELVGEWPLMLAAAASAFAGAYIGSLYLKKMTITWIRWLVGALILAFGLLLSLGIL
jgi:uncharacterized membrane protein YfcA